MADDPGARTSFEPTIWYLSFRQTTPVWWVRLLARGRFQHVSAFGWVPDTRLWLFYDVGLYRTQVYALPDGPLAHERIEALHRDAAVVAFTPRGERSRWVRLGFWCCPAIAHLIGLRAFPLRPDAMFRAVLREGGALCGAQAEEPGDVPDHGHDLRRQWSGAC